MTIEEILKVRSDVIYSEIDPYGEENWNERLFDFNDYNPTCHV